MIKYHSRCGTCKVNRWLSVVDSDDKKTQTLKFEVCGHNQLDIKRTPTVNIEEGVSNKELSGEYDIEVKEKKTKLSLWQKIKKSFR